MTSQMLHMLCVLSLILWFNFPVINCLLATVNKMWEPPWSHREARPSSVMVAQKEKPENIELLSRHKNCYKILSSIPSPRVVRGSCHTGMKCSGSLLSKHDLVAILISTNHAFNSKCSRKFIINYYVVSWILNNEFIQFGCIPLLNHHLENCSSLGWSLTDEKTLNGPPHTSIWMDAWLPSKSNHGSYMCASS